MACYWEIKNQKKFPIDSWNQFCRIRKRIFHYLRSVIWKLKSEIRNQKSEIRNQKSEIRNRKSEIRNQKSEIRNQKSEIRNRKSEIGNRKSEIRNKIRNHVRDVSGYVAISFPEPTCLLVSTKTRSSGIINKLVPRAFVNFAFPSLSSAYWMPLSNVSTSTLSQGAI